MSEGGDKIGWVLCLREETRSTRSPMSEGEDKIG